MPLPIAWPSSPHHPHHPQPLAQALHACERVFGADTNERGYKVLRGVGVIQGDGINMSTIAAILDAAIAAGYSAGACMRFSCARLTCGSCLASLSDLWCSGCARRIPRSLAYSSFLPSTCT